MKRRTGGQILVDQLKIHGVRHIFCVPGESYLAVLDALHDADIELTVCRQEGGAAMMAEAHGKLTARPGICLVTRGPGATNASPGVHIAMQDSTPLIVFVGQVERGMREREAFQELDYRAAFGALAKWTVEIDDAERVPELVSRAFHVATSGRPGPVIVALPEDMLTDMAEVPDARTYSITEPIPSAGDVASAVRLISQASRPLIIAGGSRWNAQAVGDLIAVSERFQIPVAVSFRRQMLFPASHKHYVGDLGAGSNPKLAEFARNSDLVLLLGTRLSEMASQSYTLLDIPVARQKLIHVHPSPDELGRIYEADLAINATAAAFLDAVRSGSAAASIDHATYLVEGRRIFEAWNDKPTSVPGAFNLGEAICALRDELPEDAIICNGAGNYAVWVHRFWRFERYGTQLAPTSGSMGYGVPAAVGAKRLLPDRTVVAFAGDGCYLMNGQEFATAVQYDLPIIVIVADNGMYGTIRMHQERHYPERVVGTGLKNPDFAAYARAFGGHGETVRKTTDFMPAFRRAQQSGKPAIVHCIVDPEALTPARSLSEIRSEAKIRLASS